MEMGVRERLVDDLRVKAVENARTDHAMPGEHANCALEASGITRWVVACFA